MLNLIKTISKKHVIQTIPTHLSTTLSLLDQISFTFSDQKDLALYQAQAEQRLKNKFNKRHAKKELVEHLYFRDDSERLIQEELDDFLEKSRAEQEYDPEAETEEVPEEFIDELQQLSSSYPNTDSAERKLNRIDSPEAASKAIRNIDVNDHLLKCFMKYRKFFGHRQMMELFKKLHINLSIQEAVRQREIEKFNLKVQRLQKISPQIGIKFGTVFFTKEEIGRHDIFESIISSTNSRIEQNIGSTTIPMEYYLQFMGFRPLKEFMVPDFLDVMLKEKNLE